MRDEEDGLARARERVGLLIEIARDLQSAGVLPEDRIILRESRVSAAVYAYFSVNDAYKRWRIEEGHNTQPSKIAALQCLCIIRFSPFKPLHADDAKTIAEARSNEIYCVAIMAAILDFAFTELSTEKKDQYLRILDLLHSYEIETIEPIIQDMNYQIRRKFRDYELTILPSDRTMMDALMTICELLKENSTFRRAQPSLS